MIRGMRGPHHRAEKRNANNQNAGNHLLSPGDPAIDPSGVKLHFFMTPDKTFGPPR